MDFLNEKNTEDLIVKDLQQLGQQLQQTNQAFKLALAHKLRAKVLSQFVNPVKKLCSLRWAWLTAPAALLLLVILAEAAEYSGLEIKPYQYLKTTVAPAVNRQIKITATAIIEEVKKIADNALKAKLNPATTQNKSAIQNKTVPNDLLELTSVNPLILFQPLTEQQQQILKEEIKSQLGKNEQMAPNLQPSLPAQQQDDYQYSLDFQPTEPLVLENDVADTFLNEADKLPESLPSADQEPVVKKLIDSPPTTDALVPPLTAPIKISYQPSENIKLEDVPPTTKAGEAAGTPSTIMTPPTPPSQPYSNINIPPAGQKSAGSITELGVAAPAEQANGQEKTECQNRFRLILKINDLSKIDDQFNNRIDGLDIEITEYYSSSQNLTIILTLPSSQYYELKKSLASLTARPDYFEEEIIYNEAKCQETVVTIYVNKRISFFEWLISNFR
ncbi:hypothetical protein KJ840_01160 [Patescibacteria group bacterium]|nr:hypothetical protein [Patescibacteria group bacterium]